MKYSKSNDSKEKEVKKYRLQSILKLHNKIHNENLKVVAAKGISLYKLTTSKQTALLCVRGELEVSTANTGALTGEESAGDFDNVSTPLTQGRQFERDNVQAVVQVFTELANLGQVLEVPVGRSDQAHIDFL